MRIFMVVAVLALAPVTMAVQNQPSGTQERKAAQQSNPTAPVTVNCNCTTQTDDGKDQPQGWHKLIAWPEGVATWALIFTLGAIVWQAIETRRSVQVSLRPRLIIRGIAVDSDVKGWQGWHVECQIVNVGGSKAWVTESNLTIDRLGITAEDRLPTFPPYDLDRNWLGTWGIAPAEHKRIRIALGAAGSAVMLSFLRTAREQNVNVIDNVYCFGFLQYRDAFRIQRRTAFCLHYNSVVERFERVEGKRAENYDYAD